MPPPGFKAPSMKELRRIEAEIRAIVPPACTKCAAQQSQYRCWECPVGERFCKNCVLTQHARLPLHSIEFYAGPTRGFVPHTLQSLGMRIPLGHDGSTCPQRVTDTNVAVTSTNGVHNITVDFCGCGDKSPAQQLLDAHILPSSTDMGTNTAATFPLVGHFDHSGHVHNQRSRISEPDGSAEVAARRTEIAARRVEEQEEIARSAAEMTVMWESEVWNTAMDAVKRDISPGPPLFSDFLAKALPAPDPDSLVDDDVSMQVFLFAEEAWILLMCNHRDLGYDDEVSEGEVVDVQQHWSQRPIICDRSVDSESVLREWSNLNMLAHTSKEMGPGQRRSILDDRIQQDAYRWHALEKGRSSRSPSNKRAAKIKLFTTHEEFRTTAPLEGELDNELVSHLVKRAYNLRYKARQARGMRGNERVQGLLWSQDARVRRRLSELV
ncbi:hypothetical protein C8R43DRAFT_1133997 [Mycena crocata]|nr:hypothetical protein C8R43DRAFT_1133997 [Mycena crocata]